MVDGNSPFYLEEPVISTVSAGSPRLSAMPARSAGPMASACSTLRPVRVSAELTLVVCL